MKAENALKFICVLIFKIMSMHVAMDTWVQYSWVLWRLQALKLEFIGDCESSEFRSYGRTEVLLSPSAPKEGDF